MIGRSLVVGKPVAMLLLQKNATVTICHTRTENPAAEAAGADILIAAAGHRGMIDRRFLSEKQTVIDVGINVDDEGHLHGDVAPEAKGLVSAMTPVPGGVGAVTTSLLMSHVTDAAKKLAAK